MTRFAAGKLPASSKTVSKSQKIKPLLEKEALRKRSLSICGKVPVCLPLTLSPPTLFCHCISSSAFSRTPVGKHFELIQIFKALATKGDVRLCV